MIDRALPLNPRHPQSPKPFSTAEARIVLKKNKKNLMSYDAYPRYHEATALHQPHF